MTRQLAERTELLGLKPLPATARAPHILGVHLNFCIFQNVKLNF
jgi:hypothetical protein